jgi:transcriptional regulator with XRE-family HTH domain
MVRAIQRIDVLGMPAVTVQRLKTACYERDVAEIYRILGGLGWSQRALAALTGQSQSEISEILSGRQVRSYDLFVRIFEGLDLPRAWGGLSYAGAIPPVPVTELVRPVRPRWVQLRLTRTHRR